jgi:diguanylate cyclase (GGDEF)-like protein
MKVPISNRQAGQSLILIVDDSPLNVQMLAGILSTEYNLALAANGAQALEIVAQSRPDLILMDVMMPDLNGYEVCRRLKADPASAGVPVIFLTAKTESEDIIAGFNAGGVDYLTKPFIREELFARIGVHLRLQHLVLELEAKNQELQRLAETDELTGLVNRRFLLDRLRETIRLADRHHFPVSVLMLDIDFFKQVNDRWGHQAGDEVLVRVATALRDTVRSTDWVGRYGGEEFLVVLTHTDLASAAALAEKIRTAVAALVFPNPDTRVTISGGLAILQAGEGEERLIARADAGLYQAKEAGRNRIAGIDGPA